MKGKIPVRLLATVLDWNLLAARALLFDPRLDQFLRGSDCAFDALAVGG